jgi:predicted component of type VI protein secretion system
MLPLVITVEQLDGATRRYAFAESPVSIGRSPFAELQLCEAFVSRWEGTLRFDEHEISYFNLASTNATYLDGKPVSSELDIALAPGSALTIGELKLRVSREPVAEADLRRRGKRRPTRNSPDMGVKTVYLDAFDGWSTSAGGRRAAKLDPNAGKTIVLCEDDLAEVEDPAVAFETSAQNASIALTLVRPVSQAAPIPEPSTLAGYREARAALVSELQATLSALPRPQRAKLLMQLCTSDPELSAQPELSEALRQAGISSHNEDPELRAWLQAIKGDLMPDFVHFDSQLARSRVLGLVEVLIQSLAEIHEAQDSVRKRWLGRSARRSVLQSDKGRVVLAYLLNPQADWDERLRELEDSVRDIITHELALFRATLDGARSLVESVSPQAVTLAVQDSEPSASETDEQARGVPFWRRWLARVPAEVSLWRRFVSLHTELAQDARYERVFLGRVFVRSYLAALGQADCP